MYGNETLKCLGRTSHKALKLMDSYEVENWRKIKAALEAAGKTDTHFYKRAVSIISGAGDYMTHPPLNKPE